MLVSQKRHWLPTLSIMLVAAVLLAGVATPAQADEAKAQSQMTLNKGDMKIQDNRSLLEKVYDYASSFFSPRTLKTVTPVNGSQSPKGDVVKTFMAPQEGKAAVKKENNISFTFEKSFVSKDHSRTSSTETDISRSMYPCGEAINPSPADGASSEPCAGTTTLRWTDTNLGSMLYNVYFEAGNPSPMLHSQDLTARSLVVGPLLANTTYFWRVETFDPNGGCDPNQGVVWSFTTQSPCDSTPTPFPTETPTPAGCDRPHILLAGYGSSTIDVNGGLLQFLAAVDQPNLTVEIWAGGAPAGVFLQDDGLNGDFAAGDLVYGWQAELGPLAPLTAVLELVASTSNGCTSDIWPYLNVRDPASASPDNASYFERKATYAMQANDFAKLVRETIEGPKRTTKEARDSARPTIFAGGYMMTEIVADATAQDLEMTMYALPGSAGSEVISVELYYGGQATGTFLTANFLNPGLFTLTLPGSPLQWQGLQGRYQLETVAKDQAGRSSTIWPLLTVE